MTRLYETIETSLPIGDAFLAYGLSTALPDGTAEDDRGAIELPDARYTNYFLNTFGKPRTCPGDQSA